MQTDSTAAERIWFGVAPDGTEHQVTIRIGIPTLQPGGEWMALVALHPLESHQHRIAGVDSWQAISLAKRFAAIRVGHFAEDGWGFYWERGGTPAQASQLADDR